MSLTAFGINHDTASVDVREKVAFAPGQMPEALQSFCQALQVNEVAILSTCNRTEIITDIPQGREGEILHWLAEWHHLPDASLQSSVYCHTQEDAIHHMMKVAAGLDSMILGEPQILGQMKSAYAVAVEAGTVSARLNHAFQHTFNFAKKIRSQTAIGENPVSVAFAAVHLSQRIFSDLSETTAMLIGAGETIDLVGRHLREKNVRKIIVANRTLANAQELALRFQAEAIMLPDIPARLHEADIVISSTASQLPILGKGAVENAIRKRRHKPMFMMDIAVPRDIEPEVSQLRDVYLYTVDDLRDVIDQNRRARQEEAQKADVILDEGVKAYRESQRLCEVVPVIRAFREQAEKMRDAELEKALKQVAGGIPADKVLETLARNLTNKLIHAPNMHLKQAGAEGDAEAISQFARLFDLTLNEGDSPE